MACGPQTPESYLAAFDMALVTMPRAKRIAILEDALRRVDRLERALWNWAAGMGGEEPPTPFRSHDLGVIALGLGKRLAAARDEERGATKAMEARAAAMCLFANMVFVGGLLAHAFIWRAT